MISKLLTLSLRPGSDIAVQASRVWTAKGGRCCVFSKRLSFFFFLGLKTDSCVLVGLMHIMLCLFLFLLYPFDGFLMFIFRRYVQFSSSRNSYHKSQCFSVVNTGPLGRTWDKEEKDPCEMLHIF